jgi:hypothetical protein
VNNRGAVRKERFNFLTRGVFIAAAVAAYSWYFKQPSASLAQMFLVGAGLQVLVLVIRRLVTADLQPKAMEIFELLADGATVLSFSLGVFGGILQQQQDIY